MDDLIERLREVLALSNKERDAEENREYGAANDLYAELQVAAVNLIRTHGPALLSAREDAERLAEALALLPDEIDMIEHNPDEGMLMSCCGREVKSRGLYGLVITHDKDCWYVSMCALRDA